MTDNDSEAHQLADSSYYEPPEGLDNDLDDVDWDSLTDDLPIALAALSLMYSEDTVMDSLDRVLAGEHTQEDIERINEAIMSMAKQQSEE